MPAPFILPPNPGFGSQLGQNLGQGLSQGIGASLNQFLEQKKSMGILKSLGLGVSNPSNEAGVPGISSSQSQQNSGLQNLRSEQVLAANIQDPRGIGPAITALYENQQKNDKTALQETKDLRSSLNQGFISAKSNKAIYDRMEKLNEQNLAKPFTNTVSEYLDIPISVLSNPASEEFSKLSNTLSREISNIYQGRILASEFQNFLKQIPTLSNSKEGRTRIIETLRLLDKPKELQHNAYREVLKETGGKVPIDLHERIIQKIEPDLDNLGAELNNKIETVVNAKGKGKTLKKTESSKRLQVYDSNGQVVGSIDESESKMLPQGFTAK